MSMFCENMKKVHLNILFKSAIDKDVATATTRIQHDVIVVRADS